MKKIFILFSVSLGLLFYLLLQKDSETKITEEIYNDLYEQQSDWSINQFPATNPDYNASSYAWGWSYVANSLVDMYRVTEDKKYLDILTQQIDYIFSQTDEKLGIESFTGTGHSLPAWSDRGHYTSGEFNYTYPVHTGMITLPILRFVDTVYTNNLNEYKESAVRFLAASGEALAVHNQDNMWVDFSDTEGFYIGHPYGEGYVSEANKIGIPNRISVYLAAAGLYDKLTEGNTYSERIKKSLNYFKDSLFKYDEEFDSYYWSYWEEQNIQKPWEDISHAMITVYGIFILHEEAGYTVFTEEDFEKIANNVYKVIDDESSPPQMRKFIHKRGEEEKAYYTSEENPYYYDVLRWSFLGVYDEEILDILEEVYEETNVEEMNPQTRLNSIASYLYAKEKTRGIPW
ncbi:hypothetical protein [Oceanobacillus profundus]|uniref:D-glucuronyl C5-epimerase C-terminal domain-containing protein n=1 Tax=Oceanobacillus profundus TaxID=372463 RepID=A0A417YCQ2_9BACI|nr:hypothetical protein [Oceanobacillus profundus]RHW30400.1 hypothetical protein D1B32_17685 [Oceanobacillus profundus]